VGQPFGCGGARDRNEHRPTRPEVGEGRYRERLRGLRRGDGHGQPGGQSAKGGIALSQRKHAGERARRNCRGGVAALLCYWGHPVTH
jgi:hypothetical protein